MTTDAHQSFPFFHQATDCHTQAENTTSRFNKDNPFIKAIEIVTTNQSDIGKDSKAIVEHLLHKEWGLPPPSLILSIIGNNAFDDSTTFSMRSDFIQDLVATIIQTNAWIFTDGKDSGITKIICEAIRQIRCTNNQRIASRIACIGIIDQTPQLGGATRGNNQVNVAEIEIGNRMSSGRFQSTAKELMQFEYYHSHCLSFPALSDTQRLAQYRCAIEQSASDENFHCPIIQILAEGDRYTLETVFHTVQRTWPVLIIKSKKKETRAYQIEHSYRQLYGSNSNRNEKDYQNYQKQFKEHADRKDSAERMKSKKAYFLLNFYSIQSKEPTLYQAILDSLFNWTKVDSDPQKQRFRELRIAITWDYREEDLLEKQLTDKLDEAHLHRALLIAIFQNRVHYVDYLFENGALIESEQSPQEINRYWQIIEPDVLPYRDLTRHRNLTPEEKSALYHDYDLIPTKDRNLDAYSESAIRDWILWSALMDRPEMAKCLCSYTQVNRDDLEFWHSMEIQNPVVAALILSRIYRKAANRSRGLKQQEEYRQHEQDFDRHAAKIIDQCFEIDDQMALDVLLTPSNIYFNQAPLILAESNKSRAFLATKTMWKHIDQMWYGDVDEQGYSKVHLNFLLFISSILVFPIFIPAVQKILICRSGDTEEKWYKRLKNFYRRRVAVRFFFNIIIYILFLGLFSYLLLAGYFPLNINGGKRNGYANILIPVNEIFVHIFSWCFILEEAEEFRRHIQDKRRTQNRHIFWVYYTDNKWNMLDLITYITYVIGFVTRFIVNEQIFTVSKIFMCINLFLWYVRILHLFFASEKLGPKLLMIFNTMIDLVFFICFILIFLLGYSVTSYALITTKYEVFWIPTTDGSVSTQYTLAQGDNNGTSLWKWNILRNALDWGVWKIYGQVDIINYEGVDSPPMSADGDAYGNVAFVLTIIFVCVANVLLLNVLVALFNATIQRIQERALESWSYHRFLLIMEYRRKSILPPPISLFAYLRKIYIDCCRREESSDEKREYPLNVTRHPLWRQPKAKMGLSTDYNSERESYIARCCGKSERTDDQLRHKQKPKFSWNGKIDIPRLSSATHSNDYTNLFQILPTTNKTKRSHRSVVFRNPLDRHQAPDLTVLESLPSTTDNNT